MADVLQGLVRKASWQGWFMHATMLLCLTHRLLPDCPSSSSLLPNNRQPQITLCWLEQTVQHTSVLGVWLSAKLCGWLCLVPSSWSLRQ
jgi:hypothetical protein